MPGLVKDWRKTRVKNIDDWLAKAPEFSRPICAQLREWIFQWEPDLNESIKWGMASFSGAKLVCVLGAFKKHATIFFPRGTELPDQAALFNQGAGTRMRAIRITTLEGFNRPALRALLRAAVLLDAEPAALPPPPAKRKPLPMPDFLKKALKENPKSAAGFKTLAPTYQREYINWLRTAKRPETRAQRLAVTHTAVAAGRKYSDRRLV
jgi:uncharacterized protein YdeI (YjbR/CyaY-like superfamily)